MKPSEVIAYAKEHGAQMVDFKFLDLLGMWQHFGVPMHALEESLFEDGLGFGGSSICGWKPVNASDMLMIPEPATARLDPFRREPTLSLICGIFDPVTREPYGRDPRFVAQKAERYLQGTGIADQAYFGPEAEFFVFDDVRFEEGAHRASYQLDSVEGPWNSGRDEGPNLGYKLRAGEGRYPVAPNDTLDDLRTEMVLELERLGIQVEAQHHEVASAGQCEIDIRYGPLCEMGDTLMWFKYVVKNVARRHGRSATFMPKPIVGDNGSGMHTHISLWKQGNPLFVGDRYAGISELAAHFIGGLLAHGRALCALTNASTNSYRRLVPGFEAPINLAYSSRNRSAAVRIPMYSAAPQTKRVELRTPDPACNPYLAFAAMLMAGLDGVRRRLDPGEPLDCDLYSLPPEQLREVPRTPTSFAEALDALEADHDFLLEGDVFTEDLIEAWVGTKRDREVTEVRLRPTPHEFSLYYDV